VSDERDQMTQLTSIAGTFNPYVLDISWEDAEGKSRFQRIPVGIDQKLTQTEGICFESRPTQKCEGT